MLADDITAYTCTLVYTNKFLVKAQVDDVLDEKIFNYDFAAPFVRYAVRCEGSQTFLIPSESNLMSENITQRRSLSGIIEDLENWAVMSVGNDDTFNYRVDLVTLSIK